MPFFVVPKLEEAERAGEEKENSVKEAPRRAQLRAGGRSERGATMCDATCSLKWARVPGKVYITQIQRWSAGMLTTAD